MLKLVENARPRTRLVDMGVVRAQGADAIKFLQGQVSNDVARLTADRSVLAGLHNPQGRAIALLRLVLAGPEEILALVPRELAAPVAARLARFVLRAKVKIADVSAEWEVAGVELTGIAEGFADAPIGAARRDGEGRLWVCVATENGGAGAPAPGHAPAHATSANATSADATSANATSADATSANATSAHATSANATSAHATSANATSAHAASANATSAHSVPAHAAMSRWLVASRATAHQAEPRGDEVGAALDVGSPLPPMSRDEWRALDIAAGIPQVVAATSEAFVAQMLNLDLLDGIAFDKGCYTGQEVIARAHYRGKVKRRMQRFRTLEPTKLDAGDARTLSDGRNVKVVDAVQLSDGRSEFLAVTTFGPGSDDAIEAPATASPENPTVNAEQLPLPYSLPA